MIISDEWKAVDQAFSTFFSSLDRIREHVQQSQAEWQQHCTAAQKKMDDARKLDKPTQTIRLNVGGQPFRTTKATLLSVPESFFWCLLHSDNWNPDDNGEYFIDRSPTVFPIILQFLREQKQVSTSHLSSFEAEQLTEDVDFYGLSTVFQSYTTNPANPLCWRYHTSDTAIDFTDKTQRTVRLQAGGPFNCQIAHIVSTPLKSVGTRLLRWRITLNPQSAGYQNPPLYIRIAGANAPAKVWPGCQFVVGAEGPTRRQVVECEFDLNTNRVKMRDALQYADQKKLRIMTADLGDCGITEPVCTIVKDHAIRTAVEVCLEVMEMDG
eukprot:TRINITY_DN260_c0_g1_i1.p1 TRINITY_DN260_c0_g1~~TRINITY_DN260_c0_g1_i1.p1  ORF type:complete len:333 (-),score=24.61 TRINITY_DN260_c0_g1_i1:175-1146(-)